MNHAGDGSAAATSPGVRRIPDAMVLPTMMVAPKRTPRTLRRPRDAAARGGCSVGGDGAGAVGLVGAAIGAKVRRGPMARKTTARIVVNSASSTGGVAS